MTFNKAKKVLKKMVKGKYCSIHHEITIYDGQEIPECRVYVEGYSFYKGKTWKEALEKLKVAMNLSNKEYKAPDEREEPK